MAVKTQPKKKEVTPPSDKSLAPEQKQIVAFVVPADLMDAIVRYMTPKPYLEVEKIIEGIKTRISPIYKADENEKKDSKPSDE